MDWSSVAGLLADRSERPVAVLDRTNRIRLFNAPMERMLGWGRYEVLGQSWAERCAPTELVPQTRQWLTYAQRGALRRFEAEAITRDARRLTLTLDLAVVGRGRDQGLLLTVDAATPVQPEATRHAGEEFDYEILSAPSEFGLLKRLLTVGAALRESAEGQQYCYQLFQGRTKACLDCPVLRDTSEPWPRITIRRPGQGSSGFEIVRADVADATTVRLSVRVIAEATLEAIHGARIRELADKAHLSERERDVLTYLVMGRSLEDIATILDITPRTVKFHQANVLQKLGADSRADLVRLVL